MVYLMVQSTAHINGVVKGVSDGEMCRTVDGVVNEDAARETKEWYSFCHYGSTKIPKEYLADVLLVNVQTDHLHQQL